MADLAVARLFITKGWELLSRARAPRWALRAARLACQATIIDAGSGSELVRAELHGVFGQVAGQAGTRWAEVPDEALLTIGAGRQALARAWPVLLAAGHAGLRTILRLADQRYVAGGIGDVMVLEPLVELAYCGDVNLGQDDTWDRHGTGAQIRRLVIAWLLGLIAARSGSDPVRQRVRDRILALVPEPDKEFAIEALAMLGPDLDDRTEAFLRAVPGGYLEPAVEATRPGSRPERLPAWTCCVALAASYYLMDPAGTLWRTRVPDGIRPHHATTRRWQPGGTGRSSTCCWCRRQTASCSLTESWTTRPRSTSALSRPPAPRRRGLTWICQELDSAGASATGGPGGGTAAAPPRPPRA